MKVINNFPWKILLDNSIAFKLRKIELQNERGIDSYKTASKLMTLSTNCLLSYPEKRLKIPSELIPRTTFSCRLVY